jgi:hypothetical protein
MHYKIKLGLGVQACNPSILEAEAEGCRFYISLGSIEKPCLRNKTKA